MASCLETHGMIVRSMYIRGHSTLLEIKLTDRHVDVFPEHLCDLVDLLSEYPCA